MKLAIVHDWIGRDIGGAERVLKEFTHIWPEAPVYTIFADRHTVREHFPQTDIRVSWLNRVPGITWLYPYLAPLMPPAIESFDLAGFDTVLSSSVMFAKGIVVRPGTRHICYCYSPSRMLWDRSVEYEHKGFFSHAIRHILRTWDHAAATRADQMIAISQTVARRIAKYYRRDAIIIPPPVCKLPETLNSQNKGGDYFLIVARLVPHKKINLVLEAFSKLRYPLIIAGDGPLRRHLTAQASSNVRFTGKISDEELGDLYASCMAVIIPNEEDFGLTAVEAMAHGKPVLALRRGGALETVLEGITGEFFDDPIPEALADGVRRITAAIHDYDPVAGQTQAEKFSLEHFTNRMKIIVEQ